MKDATCTVRDIAIDDGMLVQGFVRVLDASERGGDFRLLMLCDEDPIVWRLGFAIATPGEPHGCLTGLTYLGRWGQDVVFMHPPTRATDEPWKPHQADMTLVEPTR
jgi:hypothetical protein